MPFISADRSRLDRAAGTIDTYVSNHKNKMNSANGEISTLSNSWQGRDFNQFRTQWNRVTANDSTSQKMISAMENYARFLRFASNRYKEAQANAVNRANSIPKW
jgi:WXG100 family type VII secretion target